MLLLYDNLISLFSEGICLSYLFQLIVLIKHYLFFLSVYKNVVNFFVLPGFRGGHDRDGLRRRQHCKLKN